VNRKPEKRMGMKAKKQMTIEQLRNLHQYRNKTEEELEKIQHTIMHGDFDERMQDILASFEEDYDLSNMTANDKLALTETTRIFVLLSDMEAALKRELNEGETDWTRFEKINKIAASLRGDVSKLQQDLNITRKSRESSEGQSVTDFIIDLKTRAKSFLADRLCEVYCPKCGMLLSKVWFLYKETDNKLELICGRESCGHKFSVTNADFTNNKNLEGIGPPL